MEIPEGIELKIEGNRIIGSSKGKTSFYEFNDKFLTAKITGKDFEVATKEKKERRKLHAMKNAVEAHVKNLFNGLTKGFEKKLQVVYAHFPVSIETKGEYILIKNFLGEKLPRKAKIVGQTLVKTTGQDITVSGINPDDVGQTAANIVTATKIKEKDVRVFQDGIYLVK